MMTTPGTMSPGGAGPTRAVTRAAAVFLMAVALTGAFRMARAAEPSVQVRGRLTSPELDEAGIALRPLFIRVTAADGLDVRVDLSGPSAEGDPVGEFEFRANPGGIQIEAHAENALPRKLPFTVPLGSEVRDLGDFELSAPPFARVGEPAPALAGFTGTLAPPGPPKTDRAAPPFMLADFWGTWCKPCLAAFPSLYALHDEFGPDRLSIIAVHDATYDTVAELEKAVREIADASWGGRMPPFMLLLDSPADRDLKSRDGQRYRGALTARWGVLRFPTSVLIGPDGTILARVSPHDINGIRALLGSVEGNVTRDGSEAPEARAERAE